jgi:hypothetical protein
MNSGLLKAAVIQILKDRDNEPAPEKYIMLALNVQYQINATYSELRAAIKDMDEKGFLVGVHNDDDIPVWGLSTKGKHRALSFG